MTEKFKNHDDEEVTDKAMDDDEDDTTEVIGQPHPRHQEPPARSPLLTASIQYRVGLDINTGEIVFNHEFS